MGGRIRAFNWCQNQRPWMTMKGHYAVCFKTHACFGAHHENLNEDRLNYQQRRCSPMTLVSSGVSLVYADIRRGSLERWRQTSDDNRVIENVDFQGFRTLRLRHLRK